MCQYLNIFKISTLQGKLNELQFFLFSFKKIQITRKFIEKKKELTNKEGRMKPIPRVENSSHTSNPYFSINTHPKKNKPNSPKFLF